MAFFHGVFLLITLVNALEIELLSKETICFAEEVAEHTLMILEFKTREERPDEKPLNVTVSDPANDILYSK